jgi:hypothetical protein
MSGIRRWCDVAKQFFTGEPQSGTAPRAFTLGLLSRPREWPGAAVTAGLLGGNRVLQGLANNPAVQRNMVNTSLGAPIPDVLRGVRPAVTAGNAYLNQTVPNQ